MENKTEIMDEKYVLMDLKNGKAIANAIQNETSTKILDYLTTKEDGATESEIAKDLGINLSTAHYNIQQLKKVRLLVADEYHYSKKGKEILHYKLAKKLIIIAPGDTSIWKDLIKKIIPAVGIVGVASLFIKNFIGSTSIPEADMMIKAESARALTAEALADTAVVASNPVASSPAWIYFLLGASIVLITFIIMELILRRK